MITKKIKLLIPIIGIVSVSVFGWASQDITKTSNVSKRHWEDKQVRITLEKFERTEVLPSDRLGGRNLPQKSKEGYIYLIVTIGIKQIKGVYIVDYGGNGTFEGKKETSALIDTEGNTYPLLTGSFTIRIRGDAGIYFEDKDIEIHEGSECLLIFDIPKHSKPKQLKSFYSYSESRDKKSVKTEKFDILF